MTLSEPIIVNRPNEWRLETPGGSESWDRSPYPGSTRKYFMVSADTHIGPPSNLFRERVEPEYRDRVPRMRRDPDGKLWTIEEGRRPTLIVEDNLEGEDLYRNRAGSSYNLEQNSNNMERRMADLDLDGIDAELVFPNGAALMAFWSLDPLLMEAQFRVYNDWAAELSRPYRDRMNIAACIATADVARAVTEVQRVAKLGYRVITLPNQPLKDNDRFNYNLPEFDPFWAAIEEADLTITFHISAGSDPRAAKGPGVGLINFAYHAIAPSFGPVVHLCVSGVLDRFPKLRFAIIEAGVGWVPWLLDLMDEGYRKHHMWVAPALKHGLPSDYFRHHGGATFGEDRAGLALAEAFDLQNNFCWANDYPHHEGTFPHSAQAIERHMGGISEDLRAKLLGLNAARLFRFDIPARYLD
jgi:predicted TIM-barrel fold metal-dependent hydrolase